MSKIKHTAPALAYTHCQCAASSKAHWILSKLSFGSSLDAGALKLAPVDSQSSHIDRLDRKFEKSKE